MKRVILNPVSTGAGRFETCPHRYTPFRYIFNSVHSYFGTCPIRYVVTSGHVIWGQARFGTAQLHYFKLIYISIVLKLTTNYVIVIVYLFDY